MRLVYSKLGLELLFHENEVQVLVIENPVAFSDFIYSLWNQTNGEDGNLILSLDNKEILFSKNVDFISNPYAVDINQKRIIARLHEELGTIINQEMIEELTGLNTDAVEMLDKALIHIPYDVVYDPEINVAGLMKLFNIRNRNEDTLLADKVIHYMRLVHSILGIKLFVFLNMKMFFSENELLEIYKVADYEHIQLLLVEGCQKNILEREKLWIIDRDLCIIKCD